MSRETAKRQGGRLWIESFSTKEQNMKVCIGDRRFDTEKAKGNWNLCWIDENSNRHTGYVYCSSKGAWYVYTPSQWGNMHSWQLMTPENILAQYDRYLEDDDKQQIAAMAELDWE